MASSIEITLLNAAGGTQAPIDFPSLHHPPPKLEPAPEVLEKTKHRSKQNSVHSSPDTPPSKSATTSPTNHPGPISIPPPPSNFVNPAGVMFSPIRGLPPMTPSMPGWSFHPQAVQTPPGVLPQHYLSPGGPTSPPYYRAGGGAGIQFTPGPRFYHNGQYPAVSPPAVVSHQQQDYFPPPGVPPSVPEEMEYFPPVVQQQDYFPPVPTLRSDSGESNVTTTAVSSGDSATKPSSDPAATIRARVAGLALGGDAGEAAGTLVKEIAEASESGGKKGAKWMKKKPGFKLDDLASGNAKELAVPALPSPGRRASWGDSMVRRPGGVNGESSV